ncbi:hypothetical protein EJB05_32171, partial [Eragrostis curvula]
MEIERAMRGSSDAQLRAKYDAAVYVVRRAFALYPYARPLPVAPLPLASPSAPRLLAPSHVRDASQIALLNRLQHMYDELAFSLKTRPAGEDRPDSICLKRRASHTAHATVPCVTQASNPGGSAASQWPLPLRHAPLRSWPSASTAAKDSTVTNRCCDVMNHSTGAALLRAGYYLHRTSSGDTDRTVQIVQNCRMRIIYFEEPNSFPEIDSFTYDTASTYGLPLEIIRTDFKSGLESLLKDKPTKAIFLGTRNGDPNAVTLLNY